MSDSADYALALDVGGTFTDVILAQRSTGAIWTTKTPSTPADPSEGFFAGVAKMLALAEVRPETVGRVLHGSTVATNAILEGKGARAGLLTSAGFKFVLEIGRHDVPRKENLYAWVKPKRPVPPRLVLEVAERVELDGTVTTPLDEAACRAAAERFRALGVEAVAVVFLHGYANPVNERRAGALLAEQLPGVPISLSSDILPVFREYERSMVTALNAYVQPRVGRYVAKLGDGLTERAIGAPLLIMKSNGGVFGPAQAARQPIQLALSGPAAGAIGAATVAQASGFPDAITIDIGGTSADVSLIAQGRPRATTEGEIAGFPLPLPIVDIHTVGAGGGSIARALPDGGLAVGPESAGADPGPACYARGGELPTVTDANLVLGRIPAHLLGGEIPLDTARAEHAIRTKIAEPLGLELEHAARGILDIVNGNMVGALKVVSVERGYDPRDFALIAFGGAGPMHAGALARLLGCRTVVVPPSPGILCAEGLLGADLQYDHAVTCLQRGPDYDMPAVARAFEMLARQADADLAAEGVAEKRRLLMRQADLRYAKQGTELTVDVPAPTEGGELDDAAMARLVQAFHDRHEQLYTFADRTMPVELVNVRVRAVGLIDKIKRGEIPAVEAGTAARPDGERKVAFDPKDGIGGFVDTPVHRRAGLRAGHVVEGPAIIEQLDTTTVIFPGQTARVDGYGNLIIEVGS